MSIHEETHTTPEAAASRTAAERSPAPGRRLGLTLLVIAIAQLMLVLDDTIVNVALPSMQRSLQLPAS